MFTITVGSFFRGRPIWLTHLEDDVGISGLHERVRGAGQSFDDLLHVRNGHDKEPRADAPDLDVDDHPSAEKVRTRDRDLGDYVSLDLAIRHCLPFISMNL